MLNSILYGLIIFVNAIIGDLFWAHYILNITNKKKLPASCYATALGVCFLINLKIIIGNWWVSFVYLSGLFVGTYYHVEIEQYIFSLVKNIFKKKIKKTVNSNQQELFPKVKISAYGTQSVDVNDVANYPKNKINVDKIIKNVRNSHNNDLRIEGGC